MRALLATVLLLAAPVAAADRPAWEGYWAADARWCANAGTVGENTPDWYGRDGLFGLEWSCDIKSLEETGVGQSWAVQLECLEAGFASAQSQLFLLTPYDRLLVIGEDGHVSNLVRCAGGAAPTADSCEARGGILLGGYGGPVCAMPEPDAGKPCEDSSECSGACMADTRTCSPHYPMIGCFRYLFDGNVREICID